MSGQLLKNTFRSATHALSHCARRFPVTVGFISLFSGFLIYLWDTKEAPASEKAMMTIGYYLSMGVVLSLSMHLWGEEWKSKTYARITHTVAQILLAADALFLYHTTGRIEVIIAHGAGVLALGLSVFFLSFLKEKTDIAACNFASRVAMTLIITNVIGTIMSGGICLLAYSLTRLFGISVGMDAYFHTLVLCSVLLPALLFLGMLPQGELKHDRIPQTSGSQEGIIRYLFLPLTACYLAVLYVYGSRILINWELPTGWVSWLVVALMAGCIAIEYGLYPSRLGNPGRWKELTARWLPALVLPLLVLMTVGIVRRFNDYGVTINRLYLITLNAWFYMVCVGLIVTKARRISWIPVSFAIIFLLTSVLPVNYAGITKSVLQKEVAGVLKQAGGTAFPLSGEQYRKCLSTLAGEQGQRINDKLHYLTSKFGEESISRLLSDPETIYDIRREYELSSMTSSSLQGSVESEKYGVEIAQGYAYVTKVGQWNISVPQGRAADGKIEVPLDQYEDAFVIALDTLKTIDKQNSGSMKPIRLKCRSGKRSVVLTRFYLSIPEQSGEEMLFDFEGYLFHNEKK